MSSFPAESFAGVLLAAGRGRRMGATKQLLPVRSLAGTSLPMVAAAFDLLVPFCAERMVVVTGHDAPAVVAALGVRRFVATDSDPDADMFHSVRVGLARGRAEFPAVAGYWLHLADHPLVHPETPRALARAFDDAGGAKAVMPELSGRGGHPAIIPAGAVDAILAWKGEGGLRAFWLEHAGACARLPIDDPGTVRDIDTRDDYESAR